MPRGRPKKAGPQATKAGPGNGQTVSKLEAVRRSLAELGNDAMPLTIQEHLKKTFGIQMSPNHISNYKSLVLGKRRKGKRRGRKPKAVAGAVQEAATPVVREATREGDISLEDIQAVKELSERLGAGQVRELVGLLAR
jgi:hypothetical protein